MFIIPETIKYCKSTISQKKLLLAHLHIIAGHAYCASKYGGNTLIFPFILFFASFGQWEMFKQVGKMEVGDIRQITPIYEKVESYCLLVW